MTDRARPRAVVVPPLPPLTAAVESGGGVVVDDPANADCIVWADPSDAQGLKSMLGSSPARWVQLPFAGIESFFAAGVIDDARTWTCTKGVYGPTCAEQALGLIVLAARQLHRHARVRGWRSADTIGPHRRIAGTTAVIVGTGGIGRSLAEMLTPLRVRVVAVNRTGTPMPGAERTVVSDELADVIHEADWVVVCAALTPETRGLVGRHEIAAMKPDAWLINVARGGLVDQDALLEALTDGRIGGAALDVTDPEPLPDDDPLWDLENVIVTSHTANTPAMALPELSAMVERNVARFAAGEPLEGLVDTEAGY